jgi:glycerophosphoryl diester phosphodiesterase
VLENTPAAVMAAVEGKFASDCDGQHSGDGEAMVHHDGELGRLTEGEGLLAAKSAADLKQIAFKGTAERMLTLGDLCALVAGRVPLIVEIKSQHTEDVRLPARVAAVLKAYAGPVAAMSFDPRQVTALQSLAPGLPRGIVAERHYDHPEWQQLTAGEKFGLAHLAHAFTSKPHFVAYRVKDLPSFAPLFARRIFGMPLLTWTVRTPEDRVRAGRWADQMIFEGFRP